MLVRLRMTIYLPFLERSAFARNEDSAGRLDVELLRVVALVDGNAGAAARIDEQKRIAHGDIHESFHVGQDHRFLVDLDLYRIDEFKKLAYNFGDTVKVEINKKPVVLPFVKTFMDVPVGDSLLFIDSRGRVSIAVNQGDYSRKFSVEPPATIFIPRKGAFLKTR